MQGRARHALRGRDPSEHGEGIKFPLGHGLTEKYPSRFISDAHVDTNLFPLALQDLLDQLPVRLPAVVMISNARRSPAELRRTPLPPLTASPPHLTGLPLALDHAYIWGHRPSVSSLKD